MPKKTETNSTTEQLQEKLKKAQRQVRALKKSNKKLEERVREFEHAKHMEEYGKEKARQMDRDHKNSNDILDCGVWATTAADLYFFRSLVVESRFVSN